MNKSEREQYMKSRIFSMLGRIEKKEGRMAHEIKELKDDLQKWHNGKLKSSIFNLKVINYLERD